MTKGQRAMAVAVLYPEPEKGGRGKKGHKNCEGFSPEYLKQARIVLTTFPEVAKDVMAGTKALSEAYAEAQQVSSHLHHGAGLRGAGGA